jgi:hypothetical protein
MNDYLFAISVRLLSSLGSPRCGVQLLRVLALGIALTTSLVDVRADRPASNLTVAFGATDVTVSGARPGATIVAFGVGLGRHGLAPLLTRDALSTLDEDRDGVVTFPVRQLPRSSVWVVAELESGDYVVRTPAGSAPREIKLAAEAWRGGIDHIDIPRDYLEILVLRPGVAAWALQTADGGSADADGRPNGVLRLGVFNLHPLVGASKGPPFVVPRDLLVAVDPHTLEILVSEAGQ